MSFWIYEKKNDAFERICRLKLTGTEGLLAVYLSGYSESETPFQWTLSSPEIIPLANPQLDPLKHIIVVDLMPESFIQRCLYRVIRIQGTSEFDESDVVLACKVLYQGEALESTAGAEPIVPDISQPNDRQMLEAMRLTGGLNGGTYFWARPKMDIGAAVCPSL